MRVEESIFIDRPPEAVSCSRRFGATTGVDGVGDRVGAAGSRRTDGVGRHHFLADLARLKDILEAEAGVAR
jgi:hypothetical protein